MDQCKTPVFEIVPIDVTAIPIVIDKIRTTTNIDVSYCVQYRVNRSVARTTISIFNDGGSSFDNDAELISCTMIILYERVAEYAYVSR